jgi:DNA-binding NtrC family response regulator
MWMPPARNSRGSEAATLPPESILSDLAEICDSIARGNYRKAKELFELTSQARHPALVAGLAEAFGLMLVKVEAREFKLEQQLNDLENVRLQLEHALAVQTSENIRMKRDLGRQFLQSGIVGNSAVMRDVLRLVEQVADTSLTVLILGETGTGKELVARALHESSTRANKPFVAINCAAIPDSLLESELFGIERGVASGVIERMGRFEQVNGGTLFLDEVGDMPASAQIKLLRILETRQFERVGGRKPLSVDIRLVAATHKNLRQSESFREDLYFRLCGVSVHVPPLRDRKGDIPLLVRHFADAVAKRMNRAPALFSPEAVACLESYPWPGNVRELQHEIQRSIVLSAEGVITPRDLSPDIREYNAGSMSASSMPQEKRHEEEEAPGRSAMPSSPLADAEKRLILETLARTVNNKSETARLLGISRGGLRKKMRRLGLQDYTIVIRKAP